jgi:hypothetical protein
MLEELNGETALYPIIDDPIIYVKSPQRLTARFEALGLRATADMQRDQSCLIELALTRPCDPCGGSHFSGMWF